MTPPDEQPTLTGRTRAHRFVDFLWDRVHISTGAAFFILVSLLFTAAVFKIDNNTSDRFTRFQTSVCALVAQSNHNVGLNRKRVQHAFVASVKQANAEQDIANALRSDGLNRLARDETVLASGDKNNAKVVHNELAEIESSTFRAAHENPSSQLAERHHLHSGRAPVRDRATQDRRKLFQRSAAC